MDKGEFMTIRQMQVFAAVCKEGSVTKAAEQLYIAQPAASRALRDLSKQCDYPLFENVGGKLKPTEEALQLLDEINDVLYRISVIEEKLNGGNNVPVLKVGCNMPTGTELMLHSIAKFEQKHPQTKLYIFEDKTADLEQKLITGDLDFAIIAGDVSDPRLIQKCIDEQEFCWICNADNPIGTEKNVNFERLSREKLILPDTGVGNMTLLESAIQQRIELRPMWTTSNAVSTLNAVMIMGYVSYLPLNIVRSYVDSGRLKIISTDISTVRKLYAVYLRGKKLNPQMREFIDICESISLLNSVHFDKLSL